MEKKIPMRTCIACRQNKPKKELIRIVKFGEEISLDKTGKANGRGAYVCNDVECVKKVCKSKLLNKTFSMPVDEKTYEKLVEDFLGK
jgi:predicted RNA-binding protein YlxR (DUF448 family)